MRSLTLVISLFLLPSGATAWHRLPPGADAWLSEGAAIRGVTVGPIESGQHPNKGYGSARAAALLDHLVAMGANWVSVTPFGRVWDLHDTEIQMDFEAPYEQNRDDVATFIRAAKARGLRVLLIPHLWVETTGWRGEIDFEEAADWRAYQASYRRFVRAWAETASDAGADALSIGVECGSWSGRFGAYWTSLIAELRSVFDGLLTYSANWEEAESVLFWDQLDLIGINAFYPLVKNWWEPREGPASDAEYVEGALQWVPKVRELTEVLQMPVLFVEVGYTTRSGAAVEPWLWPDDMRAVTIDEREQARALDAMLHAFLPHEWFSGFFLWRYYATLEDVSQEAWWGFSTHAKMAEPLLIESFAADWGSDPPYGHRRAPALPYWHPKSWLSPAPPLEAWE